MAGAIAMVATGALSPSGAASALLTNAPVPLFLFGLFVLAAGLDDAGVLDGVAEGILRRARTPADVPLLVFLAFGALSAFVVNDAAVLIGVPVVLRLARRLERSPRPLLLALMAGVTIGSVPTPFGNPQNLLVSIGSGIDEPTFAFARYLALPTLLSLAACGLTIRFRLRAEPSGPVRSVAHAEVSGSHRLSAARVREHPAVILLPVTVLGLVASDLWASVGGPTLPLYLIALAGGIATLALSPRRRTLLRKVDGRILLLFVALFVVVSGAEAGGVVAAIGSVLGTPGPARPTAGIASILLESALGSQLVSNVPWVGMELPILHGIGYGASTPTAWMALAAGATLAGNVALLGAASNLIVVAQAGRAGTIIRLGEFVRFALPLAALSLAILFACLAVGL